MLAIRFQRVGRKDHAEFRVIVQEAQRAPSSGRIVAQIGHYNPHTKVTVLDKEKASLFLSNGAQPSDRVASLLQKEGIKLPSWVKIDTTTKTKTIKKSTKLRRNQPAAEAVAEVTPEAPVAVAEEAVETPAKAEPEAVTEVASTAAPVETITPETPAAA